ncbi:MAG: sugar transferase [Terracidiphilus sp.]|jgi:exopolysaccharide biosynthesis polyprenyl glycosylphosphotransferase
MATSEFWQRVSESTSSSPDWTEGSAAGSARNLRGTAALWMVMDAIMILFCATLVTLYERHMGPVAGAKSFWHGTLIHGRSMGILLAAVCVFTVSLLIVSRQLHLYTPRRLSSFLHEQRLSVQACFTSGLLLTGTLYLMHAEDISRSIVFITIALVTILLSLRRLVYRLLLYRDFDRGIGTRNVLIVGTGPEAHALRNHLESIRHLGYNFKGFIDFPGACTGFAWESRDVVGTLDNLFQHTRKHFVDEVFFTSPCEQRGIVKEVLQQARINGVDMRVVPDMYDGLAWNNPVEYIGQFPTIPLHCGQVPEIALVLKRLLDMVISTLILIVISPVLLALALAIKFDSRGPVFYFSERIGKKGRVFRCIKFRTMVRDAEKRRADVMHMNERDGVLFKVTNDPRVTRVGRILRKYSLDELPQFFNVLHGDMSIVGPRPPIASEVREYKLSHLRRLDVTPGITGLWQVQARQDPSFDSYISLDVTYIENWSVWLDIKIILRTIGVVLAGTGT